MNQSNKKDNNNNNNNNKEGQRTATNNNTNNNNNNNTNNTNTTNNNSGRYLSVSFDGVVRQSGSLPPDSQLLPESADLDSSSEMFVEGNPDGTTTMDDTTTTNNNNNNNNNTTTRMMMMDPDPIVEFGGSPPPTSSGGSGSGSSQRRRCMQSSMGELDDIDENEESDQFDSSAMMYNMSSNGMNFESGRSNNSNNMMNRNMNRNTNMNTNNNNNNNNNNNKKKSNSNSNMNNKGSSNIARRLERMNKAGHNNNTKRWEDRSLEFRRWGGRNANQSIMGILTHLGDDDEDDSSSDEDSEFSSSEFSEEQLLEQQQQQPINNNNNNKPVNEADGGGYSSYANKNKNTTTPTTPVGKGGGRDKKDGAATTAAGGSLTPTSHGRHHSSGRHHHHHHHHKKRGNVLRRARRRIKKRIAAAIQPLLPDTSKSFEQLIRDDKRREKVASNCEEPFYKLPFHFRGTVLRVISTDILFWSTMLVFVSIRLEIRMRDKSDVEDYKNLSSNLVYVGGFMTFFLVFYVNQNHVRYFSLHGDVMTLMGRVNDVATMAKACLPMERARRIVRFMNTAHVCAYTGLSQNYSKINFLNPLDNRYALLTDDEYDRITEDIDVEAGPKAVFELLTWVMIDIRDAQEHQCIDSMEAHQLREQVLKFRSTVAKIFVTCTRPIPFFYVHFLTILTAFYCPLFAVVVAFQTGPATVEIYQDGISFLVVILQSLFTIGLRILGQQLSDPFGGELIDLQIARYVNMILSGSNQILSAKRLPPPSPKIERELKACMISLGAAYDGNNDDDDDDDEEEGPDKHY